MLCQEFGIVEMHCTHQQLFSIWDTVQQKFVLLTLPAYCAHALCNGMVSVLLCSVHMSVCPICQGGSVAEWLVCWTHVQKGLVQVTAMMLSGNSLRQTVHTHRASVHQAAKLVAALLRVARVTAGLAESNGSLPSGL